MRPLLICNPASRGGASRVLCARVFATLEARKIAFDRVFTAELNDAFVHSRKANREQRPAVVAVGGDGTINRVLNGFYDHHGHRISTTRLGVIHTGTSPDFCRSYGLPTTPEQAALCLETTSVLRAPVGMVVHSAKPACDRAVQTAEQLRTPVCSYFACCANIGLGPCLARAANAGIRRIAGDTIGTLLALLFVLARYRPVRYRMRLDGAVADDTPICNVAVGLTRFIASGIKVHHQLTPGDRRLYVLRVNRFGIRRLPFVLRAIYSGSEIPPNPAVSLSYAREVGIENSARGGEIEYDGDPAGYLPCRVSVAPDPIEVLCGAPT